MLSTYTFIQTLTIEILRFFALNFNKYVLEQQADITRPEQINTYFYISVLEYKYNKYIAGTGIAQSMHWLGYGQYDPGFESRQRQESLRIATSTPTVGPTQSSIERAFGTFRPAADRPELEAAHLTTSSAELKYEWSCTFTHSIRLHAVYTKNFTFCLYDLITYLTEKNNLF